MKIIVILLFFALFSPPVISGEKKAPIKVDGGANLSCPLDDCYLTLVNEELCAFLDIILDDSVDFYSNEFNCIESQRQSYICLNVLSRRRYSEERRTEYSDPYLLQLMTDFQVRLDMCLIDWKKEVFFRKGRQEIIYEASGIQVSLGISEFFFESQEYDRLTLEVRARPR